MGDFVHLHLHTEYSLLDGTCVIKRLVKRLKALGQTCCAITDHGNMYGAVDFYKACKAEGIKPIIGCEVYVAPRTRFDKVHGIDNTPYHLILLCKNKTGYQNLIQMVSLGYIDGFYNKPRIDRELLTKYHEGLICLSACLAGEIPRALLSGDYQRAKETVLFYQNTFGTGNYYIELQNHGMPEQKRILPLLKKLSEETGVPMVCTNDCHYLEKADSKTQSILMCIQTNTVYGQPNAMTLPTDEFYVKSAQEMESLFYDFPDAVSNTVKIAEQCNLDFEFGVTKLPKFTLDGVSDNVAYFEKMCRDGLIKRYGTAPSKEIKDRLEYELSVIEKMGYVDYYLIVWDFVHYAKEHDIPVGPGRGSGAGSLCAYCIGITGIDPIKYNLLFERFLNPERVSMPDFDVDFCIEKRQRVIDYVIRKYGSDHVAQIITFGTMAAKGAIRDVGRALGMPYQYVDTVAKAVPNTLNITLDGALESSKEFRTLYQTDEKAKELIDTAKKLEGMPRHTSTHAAGVVITRDPVSSYVPLQKNDDAIVTQYTMTTLEELGLLKMDFLGLRNLTVIDRCEKQIRTKEPNFHISDVSTDDPAVFKMLESGDTDGVFQFESAGMKRVLTQLKPTSIEDLIAVLSLYRPGPMESIPKYIQNRHNPKNITYATPLLSSILDVTYGCIVYQEQVMQICRKLAGYSYGRADLVRRAMAKKKTDVMAKERTNFIYGKKREDGSVECVGAIANGVDEKAANEIFDEMSGFASYAFNKSHAAAYALVAYQTAYLKCHYKKEYMASLLTSVLDNTDKVIEYIAECQKHGIKVLPPSVNTSDVGFTVHGEDLNFGLLAVKNLGRSVIEAILSEREKNGAFHSIFDFIRRMYGKEVNKRAVESLIRCGAFDCFPHNRRQMLESYESIMDSVDDVMRRNLSGQINLFGLSSAPDTSDRLPDRPEYPLKELLAMEKEVTGLYLSGHPLDGIQIPNGVGKITQIADIITNAGEMGGYADGDRVILLCAIQSKKVMMTRQKATMAFLTAEDKTGSIEVIIFPDLYEKNVHLLTKDAVLLLEGRVSLREEELPKIVCSTVRTVTQEKSTPLRLYLNFISKESSLLSKAISIILEYPGNDRAIFCFADLKKQMEYKKQGIQINDALLVRLQKLLGEKNVVIR